MSKRREFPYRLGLKKYDRIEWTFVAGGAGGNVYFVTRHDTNASQPDTLNVLLGRTCAGCSSGTVDQYTTPCNVTFQSFARGQIMGHNSDTLLTRLFDIGKDLRAEAGGYFYFSVCIDVARSDCRLFRTKIKVTLSSSLEKVPYETVTGVYMTDAGGTSVGRLDDASPSRFAYPRCVRNVRVCAQHTLQAKNVFR